VNSGLCGGPVLLQIAVPKRFALVQNRNLHQLAAKRARVLIRVLKRQLLLQLDECLPWVASLLADKVGKRLVEAVYKVDAPE
jgi:hypothetical protein